MKESTKKFEKTMSHLNKRKILVFKIVALLLPILLLCLFEIALRIAGFGQEYSLFIPDAKRESYLVMNPRVSEKYFNEQQNATAGNYEPFKKHKEENSFRIFVLGESTTIGYPYLHNGSFHRWLQYRLSHTFPEKHIEIINVSLTAVNSYTVLDFARQLVPHKPDAVLIYTGHNEYYGAMGVCTTNGIANYPAIVRFTLLLREFRLTQFIHYVISNISKQDASKIDLHENLMRRMALGQLVPFKSKMYYQGIKQFRSNLTKILNVLTTNGIPVFVSNVVSNEKDMKPLISDTTHVELSAIHQFKLAEQAYQNKEFSNAQMLYRKARELDLLRFRAPDTINYIIKKVSDDFPLVFYVDTQAVMEEHSPHGIIGKETLLEHVHPNLFGYALLSDAFYQALKNAKLLSYPPVNEISFAKLQEEMPVTIVDSLSAVYEIMMLKEGWPFNEPMPPDTTTERSFEEKVAGGLAVKQYSWHEAMLLLGRHYEKEKMYSNALRVSEALALEYPVDLSYNLQAGQFAFRISYWEKALHYYRIADRISPDIDKAKRIAQLLFKLNKLEESIHYLKKIMAIDERGQVFGEVLVTVKEIIEIEKQHNILTQVNTSRYEVETMNKLAINYSIIGNLDKAREIIENVLEQDPDNQLSQQILKEIRVKLNS